MIDASNLVLREGDVGAGDPIHRAERQDGALTVADIVNLYTSESGNQDLLRRATELPALSSGWKEYFRKRLLDADI